MTKQKLRNAANLFYKNGGVAGMTGKQHTEKFKEARRNFRHSKKTKQNISKHNGNKRPEVKKKLREAAKNRPPISEVTRQKMRESTINYIKKTAGAICPRIGRNEKKILDKLQKEIGYKIIRQYPVCGYFVDGYILETNLVIEVDERPKNTERDDEREKIITKELDCKFLRIKDYD